MGNANSKRQLLLQQYVRFLAFWADFITVEVHANTHLRMVRQVVKCLCVVRVFFTIVTLVLSVYIAQICITNQVKIVSLIL